MGEVDVCPECGSAALAHDAPGGKHVDPVEHGSNRCVDCGHYFDEPDTRASRSDHHGLNEAQLALHKLDPDEWP